MNDELSRWAAPTSVVRQRAADLTAVYHRVEVAEAEVAGVGQVTDRALMATLKTNLLRREVEQLAPDGAEHYRLLATSGVMEMVNVIATMRRSI